MDRMSMDGTGRTHVAEDGMLGPVVLHFDSHFHRLFLADAGTGDMEHLSTDGKYRHNIIFLYNCKSIILRTGGVLRVSVLRRTRIKH